MTKGTKIFRIIICILLGLIVLFGAFHFVLFGVYVGRDSDEREYGINVAGVDVTRSNEDDILGDGTVSYNPNSNILTFQNAEIEHDYAVVYSKVDLMIQLIGENKFVMSGETVPAIQASDYLLSKDLKIIGDGSLTIEFKGTCTDASGIYAKALRIETDITLIMPDCTNIVNGIYCDESLTLTGGAVVTVQNGAAKYSTAVKVRNNADIEIGSTLNVSVRPGSTEICRGVHVGGSLIVWEDASLHVSVDDEIAKMSKCICVPGLLSVGRNAKVTASAKKVIGIECYGSMELVEGASVSASSEGENPDILCYGAIVNYGADVHGEVEALGGVHSK